VNPRVPRAPVTNVRTEPVASGSVFSTILLQRVIADSAVEPVTSVLDVGCGRSPYRELLGPSIYVGVDRLPTNPDLAGIVRGDADALPIRAACFDGVMCTEVIEHVPDERELVRELARVARPGAVLVLSSPFVHGLHEAPLDFRRLTTLGLTTILGDAGWDVETIRCIGGPAVVTIDSALRWLDSTVRRVSRRVLVGRVPKLIADSSRWLQTLMSRVVLGAPGSRFGPVDPAWPDPRLTLGYVVVARRR